MIKFWLPNEVRKIAPSGRLSVPGGWLVSWTKQRVYSRPSNLGTWFFRTNGNVDKISDYCFIMGRPSILFNKPGRNICALFRQGESLLVYNKNGTITKQTEDLSQIYFVDAPPPAVAIFVRKSKKMSEERELICRAYGIESQGIIVFDKERSIMFNPTNHVPLSNLSVAYDGTTIMAFGVNEAFILDNPLV